MLEIEGTEELLNFITSEGATVNEIFYRENKIIQINYQKEVQEGNDTVTYFKFISFRYEGEKIMLVNIICAIQIISALLLIVFILLHSPKGDGIAGIGGASHVFTSQKSAEKTLNKVTGVLAAIFILCTFLLGYGIIK